ncbi:MAG TPA: Holliday junction branch migration DNA helicase RuvB, partial [Solirubrobacteraceae bacterium]|nr:Holliday junction branch migration DNA helicase RuvB [Solirubrobacteraceae bacterium]
MSDATARIQTPYLLAEDELDRSLRPRRLEEFIGQEALREQLLVAIEAAGARGEALDHLLLAGPPGLGKTSLAQIVAAELEVPFVQTAGPALERKGDIAAFLTALEPRSVFFVDEIHRLPRALEETFYPAMEDLRLPITVGQGAGARVVTLDLPPFTLIGATTRSGLLTTPLRDRFGIQARLEPYSPHELAAIVRRSAAILRIELQDGGALAIAQRSRGTPRVANRLLKRVRDYAEVRMQGVISAEAADAALTLLEV